MSKKDMEELEQARKPMNYVLIKQCDMADEMKVDAVDIIQSSIEKAPTFETAAKHIKETLDKKFGSPWHVIVGLGFGFETVVEQKHLLFCFVNGTVGCLCYKM